MIHPLTIVNGTIRTGNPAQPLASALVANNGEIVYVGDDTGRLALRTADTTVINARGRLVLPGFVDSHTHFCYYAQTLDRVNLQGCHSLDQVVERVAARVGRSRRGQIIRGFGWNHLKWPISDFPDRFSLDHAAPENPVLLSRIDGHTLWVNSAALRLYNITRATEDPDGGKLERDAIGEPTGLLREKAMGLVQIGIGEDDEQVSDEALLKAVGHAHAAGLTGIHNIEGLGAWRAWESIYSQNRLKLRVVHSIPAERIDDALEHGFRPGSGNEWMRVKAVKLFADGSLGSQTAEMSVPYKGTVNKGMPVTGQETLLSRARAAAHLGYDVWIHAIGDAAITRVLDIYERLRSEGYRHNIFRVEHAQHLNPVDIPRFARLNVIASMQPAQLASDMNMVDEFLGREPACFTFAFNTLAKAGARLTFGSDCPFERLEPLRGIHAAVTRQNTEGEPELGWVPQERLTVSQAAEAFTLGPALSSGDGKQAGALSIGHRADAVILSEDIFSVPPAQIVNTSVDYTIVDGEIVYQKEG